MNDFPENLIEKINNIPCLPGIYKMLDRNGKIIYVGKSISLKNRVKSYFIKKHEWNKIEKMVSLIYDIEYIVTDTHLEARLLECELIKEIKPMFNSQFKNHEKYIYLKVENYNIYNPLSIINNREDNSFGPFRRKSSLINLISSLKNIYPIEKNDESYIFQYNLIPIAMDKNIFERNKETLVNILSDDKEITSFIYSLENKMKDSASKLEFATASYYRDLIYGLNYLKTGIYGYKSLLSKDIILKIPISSGYKLFFVSNGVIILKSTFPSLSQEDIQKFTDMGIKLKSSIITEIDEKSNLDFRDILYSEIKSLPDEMVIYI